LPPFTAAHQDLPGVELDVLDAELEALLQSQPGSIE